MRSFPLQKEVVFHLQGHLPFTKKIGRLPLTKIEFVFHEEVCRSMSNNQLQTEPNAFLCDECGLLVKSKEELLRHMETNHKEKRHVKDVFWCDICPLNFDSDWNLQFYRRGCHGDHM